MKHSWVKYCAPPFEFREAWATEHQSRLLYALKDFDLKAVDVVLMNPVNLSQINKETFSKIRFANKEQADYCMKIFRTLESLQLKSIPVIAKDGYIVVTK